MKSIRYNKGLKSVVNMNKTNDWLKAPLELAIEVTGFCNLNCLYCFNENNHNCKKNITFDNLRGIINEASDLEIFEVCMSGGEPFVRKDIFDILDYIIKKSLNLSIVTNGTLIGKKEIKLLDDRNLIPNLQISIDSHIPKIHNMVRGKFQETLNAINLINYVSDNKPNLGGVIHKQNYTTFGETLTFFSDKCNNFHLMNVQPSKRAIENRDLLFIDANNLANFWENTKEIASSLSIGVDIYENDLKPLETARFIGCTAGKTKLVIKPDLDVVPCDMTRDIILGNLKLNSLLEIWNSDKRKEIANRDIEPCYKNNLKWFFGTDVHRGVEHMNEIMTTS